MFVFAACWCASAKADSPLSSLSPVEQSVALPAAPPNPLPATFVVANSQSGARLATAVEGAVVHAIPALDGFGLLVLAALLGLAVLWLWRRRQ